MVLGKILVGPLGRMPCSGTEQKIPFETHCMEDDVTGIATHLVMTDCGNLTHDLPFPRQSDRATKSRRPFLNTSLFSFWILLAHRSNLTS